MSLFKNIRILLVLFVLYNTLVFSQVNYPLDIQLADSLEKILPLTSKTEKVDVLNGISFALIRHYSDRSDSIAELAFNLANEFEYKEGLAKALFCKGTNDYIKGNFIEAMAMLYDALALYEEVADTNMIIETYYQIGSVSFFSFTDLEEGFRCVDICIDYAKVSGLDHWISQLYSSYQYLYNTAGDNENALKYLQLYTEFSKEMAVPKLEESMVIAAYGRAYSQMGEHRKALDQYLMTWPRINEDDIEERAYLAQLTYSIGMEYLTLGMVDSASHQFHKGMALSRKNKHYWGSMTNSYGLARYHMATKNTEESTVYCDSAIYFGNKIDSLSSFYGIREYSMLLGMSGELYIPLNKQFKRFLAWRVMSGAYQILLQIKEQQAKYQEAYSISKSFNRIQDSIASFQKRAQILDLQYNYQAQQKDDQIILLSKENQIQSFKIGRSKWMLFSVIAISVLLLLILILVLHQNRIKAERKVAKFKQKLLRSQMNPHFIFNSLTSIQNFILEHDDIKASVYLARFSDLVRNILSNSQVELIHLEEEVNTLENYLELQKIRFPEKFEYHINIDERLNLESINIPPMLTQPFIENAIEHGFKEIGYCGEINVNFKLHDAWLSIQISDNGIGRRKSYKMKSQQEMEHQSMATIITAERIKTINKKLKNKIQFEIIDLKDQLGIGTGTSVIFEIPLTL